MPNSNSPSLAKYVAKIERHSHLLSEGRGALLALPKQAHDHAAYRDIVRDLSGMDGQRRTAQFTRADGASAA